MLPQSIFPSGVKLKLLSSTAVPDDRADLDFFLLPRGHVWPFRYPELTHVSLELKPEEHSHPLLFHIQRAFRKQDD